jgi:hypothetical protein
MLANRERLKAVFEEILSSHQKGMSEAEIPPSKLILIGSKQI